MIPGARLIILGRQGAGKGTQCVRLSRHFVVPHISTGDMLRSAVREGTPLGVEAKKVMDAGGLVSDDIMIGIVRDRLKAADADTRGYILDGFPRTIEQADALDDITSDIGKPIDVVLDLDVPARSSWSGSHRVVCAVTAAPTTRRGATTRARGSATCVVVTSCSATTTPPIRSTGASTCTRSRRSP